MDAPPRYFIYCWQHRPVHGCGSSNCWRVNVFMFFDFGTWEGHWEICYKYFWSFCSCFGRMLQRLFIITETKDCLFYIWNTTVFSTIWFHVSVFSVSSFRGIFEVSKKKNGPPRGSINGPVDFSWNCAFCYKSPLLYKVFHSLFTCKYFSACV